LKVLGKTYTDAELNAILAKGDANKDGKISYAEFKDLQL